MKQVEWFEDWFDSKYYHSLYKNRDHSEAERFIDNLYAHLSMPNDSMVLDLACGKGRHAIHLASKGLDVTGLDLSVQSIRHAREQVQSDHLHFYTHDMRKPFRIRYYDYILNLFTSFGYFSRKKENLEVLKSVRKGLKPQGMFLLDFMNSVKVKNNLLSQEIKTVDGIDFHIERAVQNDFIFKDIRFEDGGRTFHFQERVQGFEYDELKDLFNKAGFKLISKFGDYDLNPFEAEKSNRLILLAGIAG